MKELNINIDLEDRERDILRSIVNLYIINAAPVGSRKLSKFIQDHLKLSPATIRNIMMDLEEKELITHPHTSAGRVPTDKGYRFYVDYLMQIEQISKNEYEAINKLVNEVESSEQVLKEASKILGYLSKHLALVRIPTVKDLMVKKLELIKLSSTHILVVIALESNIINTVTLEARFEIDDKNLDEISRLINERIAGKYLKELKENFADIISEAEELEVPMIRLFVDSVDKIFTSPGSSDKIYTSGTQNLLNLPEFEDLSKVKSIIELLENEEVIVHVLDNLEERNDMKVYIGSEIGNEQLNDYSLVISNYSVGSASGSIGLIGPKRMKYNKLMPLVNLASQLLSGKHN